MVVERSRVDAGDDDLDGLIVDLLDAASYASSTTHLGQLGEATVARPVDLVVLEPDEDRRVAVEVKTSLRGHRFATRHDGDVPQAPAAWISDRLARVG